MLEMILVNVCVKVDTVRLRSPPLSCSRFTDHTSVYDSDYIAHLKCLILFYLLKL